MSKIKKENSIDKSQRPFDYSKIEKLREKAWARPQVKKNWEEFYKHQDNKKIKFKTSR